MKLRMTIECEIDDELYKTAEELDFLENEVLKDELILFSNYIGDELSDSVKVLKIKFLQDS